MEVYVIKLYLQNSRKLWSYEHSNLNLGKRSGSINFKSELSRVTSKSQFLSTFKLNLAYFDISR